MMRFNKRLIATSFALALGSSVGVAHAHDSGPHDRDAKQSPSEYRPQTPAAAREAQSIDPQRPMASRETMGTQTAEPRADYQDMHDLFVDAADIVRRMRLDERLAQAIDSAKGVYIVPEYGRAAIMVGGPGGAGILVLRKDGQWTSPAQFDFGGVSAGLEAGAETGSLVMILNTDAAVDRFRKNNIWNLNAEAGLTVANWSGKSQASTGEDVLMWSDTEGLLGGVALSVTDIRYDEDQTAAFYGETVDRSALFSGEAHSTKAEVLTDALDTAS